MAIRASIFSSSIQSIALGLAILATGCVAEPAASVSTTTPVTYRDPTQIRPANETVRPKPMPETIAAAPSASAVPSPVRAWATSAPPRAWKYIIIHHSATPSGNAEKFDREHRAKGWDGLGYHFVIDNGNGGPDGRVEVGPRWPIQKWGAHAKTADNRFNQQGIGICLVGNFQDAKPSARQLASLAKLVGYLMQTYRIPAGNVLGHDDTKSTLCPGRNLSLAQVRTMANHVIAQAAIDPDAYSINDDGSEPFLTGEMTEEPMNAHIAIGEPERELMIRN